MRNGTLARALAILVLTSLAAAPAAGQESATERYRGATVRDIVLAYEGDELPEAARDLVDISSGSLYEPEAVRRSIRQLFALGAFSDIKVEAARVGDEVDLTFRLFPRVSVASVEVRPVVSRGGVPASVLSGLTPRLVEDSEVRAGDPLDVDILAEAAERVAATLRDEGYLWAEVEPEASFQSPTAVVVFHVEPGRPAQLGSLEVEGVAPHVVTHVRREIGLRSGSFYSKRDFDGRVEGVVSGWHQRGFYGALMETHVTKAAGARVDVRLVATLGPRIDIVLEGAEIPEGTLRSLIPVYEETRLTADLVEESRANIEEHLRERGHRDARVEVNEEPSTDGSELTVRFRAEPGPRYEVAAVRVEGVEPATASALRGLVVTAPGTRFRASPFREDLWKDDVEAMVDYMRRQGYYQASIESDFRVSPEEPDRLTLVASVVEGPRAIIDEVAVSGQHAIDEATLREVSGVALGAPYDGSAIVEARERLLRHYQNLGFRDAAVQAQTMMDDDGVGATVAFEVHEGSQTLVDRVIISGLSVSREASVRELVSVKSGEPLSPIDVLETRQQLVGSGLFRSVGIDVLPPDPRTQRSDVLISLAEGPRTTFAYGFGFQERQLARAEFEVTRRNLLGLNRSVSLFTRASFRGSRFITTYRQPDSIIRNLPLFVSFYAEQEQRTSFDYNRVGVGVQISKRLSEEQNLFFRYRFDRTRVFDLLVDIDEIDRRFRNTRISSLSVASIADKRDDPLDPNRGQLRILDLEWSSRLLGTGAPYLKGLAQQFFYFELPKNLVAAVGFRLGIGQTFRTDRDALLPVAERFYAGGANTLRGFALDQASPKAKFPLELPDGSTVVVDGEPLGGNVLTLLNLELRFPVLGNLEGVVFSDNGTVYRRLQLVELLNWRYNMGFGFRYDTPLGPFRVDYGFKLDRRIRYSVTCPDITSPCAEPRGRWHFSLGHAF